MRKLPFFLVSVDVDRENRHIEARPNSLYDDGRHQRRVFALYRATQERLPAGLGVEAIVFWPVYLDWKPLLRLDGFWEMDLKIWDIAAGEILIREAGGPVSDLLKTLDSAVV